MKKTNIFQSTPFWVLSAIVVIAALSRLFPHPANFTPVIAIALFAGAYFSKTKWAFIVPLAAMFFSDLGLQIGYWLGFYEFAGFHSLMPVVYLCFALVVGVGLLLRNRVQPFNLLFGVLGASVLFFLVTNFAVWLQYYPTTMEGLIECYTLAIPFFRTALFGNLFYTTVLFGSFEAIKRSKMAWA